MIMRKKKCKVNGWHNNEIYEMKGGKGKAGKVRLGKRSDCQLIRCT